MGFQKLAKFLKGDREQAYAEIAEAMKKFFTGQCTLLELQDTVDGYFPEAEFAVTADNVLIISGVEMRGQNVDEIDVPTTLEKLGLLEVWFRKCDFAESTLRMSKLGTVSFHDCNLYHADFSASSGDCVAVRSGSMQHCGWDGCTFGSFELENVDLFMVSLRDMTADSANFERVMCWQQADVEGARFPSYVMAYIEAMQAYELASSSLEHGNTNKQ